MICGLSHYSDPTLAIVSSTLANSEPLVLPGIGVIRRRPESSGVVWSCPESSGVDRRRSHSELSRGDWSQLDPSGAMFLWSGISFRCVLSFTLRVHFVYKPYFEGRLTVTPDDFHPERPRASPGDSGWLRAIPNGSRRFRKTLDNAGWNYLPESDLSRTSGLLPTLPISKSNNILDTTWESI